MDLGSGRRVDRGRQPAEIDRADHADEDPENQYELALRDQVGLAGLVNELGDFEHGPVNREVFQLRVDDQAEHQAEQRDGQPSHQQRPAVDPVEGDRAEIREHQVRLAAAVPNRRWRLGRLLGRLRRCRRLCRRDNGHGCQQQRKERGGTQANKHCGEHRSVRVLSVSPSGQSPKTKNRTRSSGGFTTKVAKEGPDPHTRKSPTRSAP